MRRTIRPGGTDDAARSAPKGRIRECGQRPAVLMQLCGLALGLLALAVLGGCFGRPATPPPAPFSNPIDSRLILQVPYFKDAGDSGAAGALAEVLSYNGCPSDPGKVRLALDGRSPSPQILTIMARGEGLKAEFGRGTPNDLLEAVRKNQPVIVRLGAAVPPLGQGDYAVVVGYTPDGPVLNSGHVNQQIIPWTGFLSGWLQDGNTIIMIEPK